MEGCRAECVYSGEALDRELGQQSLEWTKVHTTAAIIDALNRAYDVTEWRPWWKRRLLAMLLTAALALFIIIALTLVLVGPPMAFRLANWLGLGSAVALLWALI